jgi:hypothetical protein
MDTSGLGGLVFLVIFWGIWGAYLGYPLIALGLGFYVQRKLRSRKVSRTISLLFGVTLALTVLAIPFWDYPPKRFAINGYCETEGGFYVKRTIVGGASGVYGLPNAIQFGYLYGEGYEPFGDSKSLRRFYKAPPNSPSGLYSGTRIDRPSPYGFRSSRSVVEGAIDRVVLQTYVTATEEELGRYVYFENIPNRQASLSINDLRRWMRMTCPGVEPGAFPQMRELLKRTIPPSPVPED